MAVWQYPLYVIPIMGIQRKYGCIPDKLVMDKKSWQRFWNNFDGDFDNIEHDFEDARTIRWWKDSKIDIQEIASEIDELLPRGSWSNDKDFIGWKGNSDKEEDNDCHIAFDEKSLEISEFQFRTDLRNEINSLRFIDGMLGVCSNNHFLVMNDEGKLYEPKVELILEDIKNSNAAKFLKEPVKYLNEVAENDLYKIEIKPRKMSWWKKLKKWLS